MKIGYMRVFGMSVSFGCRRRVGSRLGEHVKAAGEGSITGTVKLNGTAPHMKGIDMSKDPYCVKQHKDNPATWRMLLSVRAAELRTLFCTSLKV